MAKSKTSAKSTSTRKSTSSSPRTARKRKAKKKGITRELAGTAHGFAPGAKVSVYKARDVEAQKLQFDEPQAKAVQSITVPDDGMVKLSVPALGDYEIVGEGGPFSYRYVRVNVAEQA